MTKHEEVLKFISRFTANGSKDQVIDTFQNGCCYWFADILFWRFMSVSNPDDLGSIPVIMYDKIVNHFGVEIDSRIYDITGDVTQSYRWECFDPNDPAIEKDRINRDCIFF